MTQFRKGQRVIGKAGAVLGGYYGHVIGYSTPRGRTEPLYVIVKIQGRIPSSCERNANTIGGRFPFYHNEIEAAD
jgi:hypothetical protein